MIQDYHSALKPELYLSHLLEHYEKDGSEVFYHDLTKGIHPKFKGIDALYSEPAWRPGYGIFMKRSNTHVEDPNVGFLDYLKGIGDTITELKVPSFIVMGKHMIKKLSPDEIMPIHLHKYESILGVWNTGLHKVDTIQELLKHISITYFKVLDFSCGYGDLARAMKDQNRNFICSDINKKCVYYVAKNIMDYPK